MAEKIIPSIDKLLTEAKLILVLMFFFSEKKKIFKIILNNIKRIILPEGVCSQRLG